MPLFACFLPGDQLVDLRDCFFLVELTDANSTGDECVYVEFSGLRTLSEELQNAFDPAHELPKKTVVMSMHLVDKLIEVVFVALAQVDERLNCLVRVGGDVLLAAFINDLYILADTQLLKCEKLTTIMSSMNSAKSVTLL